MLISTKFCGSPLNSCCSLIDTNNNMISFKHARDLILTKVTTFGTEEVALENALGRILDENVFAPRDFPPFNRSAMDGIALRFADLQSGIKEFNGVETVFAGNLASKAIVSGECYKIMTGAPVPEYADTVIRFEDTSEKNGLIKVLADDFSLYQHIAQQGQDLKKAELAIKKGTAINIATIGLLASMGKSSVKIQKLPLVNIITTGNEVVDLNEQISTTHIYNSNKYVLKALLMQNLIEPKNCEHVKDELGTLKKAIQSNLNADILILSGGVSAGEADFIPTALADLGAHKLFYKVAIKPGKPVWCGKLGSTMVFALPGNPFSCLVTFKLFVEFYIKACLGFQLENSECLPLNFNRTKKSSLDEFFPVNLKNGTLNKIDINGSGDVRLGFAANALAMQNADQKEILKNNPVCYVSL